MPEDGGFARKPWNTPYFRGARDNQDMNLRAILGIAGDPPSAMPEFISDIQDIRGVHVVRLRGPVGKDIGRQEAEAVEEAAEATGAFSRSVLFDFRATTECDFSTVAYLVQALRKRMAAHTSVGIINPPPQLIAELEIAKVESLFRIFASEDEAIAELAQSSPPPSTPRYRRRLSDPLAETQPPLVRSQSDTLHHFAPAPFTSPSRIALFSASR